MTAAVSSPREKEREKEKDGETERETCALLGWLGFCAASTQQLAVFLFAPATRRGKMRETQLMERAAAAFEAAHVCVMVGGGRDIGYRLPDALLTRRGGDAREGEVEHEPDAAGVENMFPVVAHVPADKILPRHHHCNIVALLQEGREVVYYDKGANVTYCVSSLLGGNVVLVMVSRKKGGKQMEVDFLGFVHELSFSSQLFQFQNFIKKKK